MAAKFRAWDIRQQLMVNEAIELIEIRDLVRCGLDLSSPFNYFDGLVWMQYMGVKDMDGVEYNMLFMRPKDDYRKDTIVKREIYQNEIEGKFNVLAVYDDRLQVLDMWYEQGIFTFNVNQGQFSF